MLMKLAQTVDVDRAVIRPDTLQQVGGSCRSLAAKRALVDQIDYVAHFPKVLFLSLAYVVRSYSSDEFARSAIASAQSEVVGTRAPTTGTGHGQPVVAVSEKSFRVLERSCRRSSFELGRPG